LDEQGQTPLHWAVFRGDIEAVETLLRGGANPNVFAIDGVTPKRRAADFGLDEIEELLSEFGGIV
jgi:ankyrin repeat protein